MVASRWEWRAFGASFGTADARFEALAPERTEESDELYLLSPAVATSVKVRGGLIEIKRRVQVNGDGLEQWVPIVKAAFPLPADTAASIFAALAIPIRLPPGTTYTLDRFVEELVRPNRSLRAVHVQKRRAHYTVNGCMAEAVDVVTEGQATRTIAIESEDPDRVIATVRGLGLSSPPNVSYSRGLAALVGFEPRRFAVIDVGTNSVKFHIGERGDDGAWQTIADRAEVTRLGEGLQDTGELGAESLERTVAAIAGMVDEANRAGAAAIAAVGTAGMRIARNRDSLIRAVHARCGVVIDVISSDDEGRLAYLAATSSLGLEEGSLVVFDTGGGSSQFTFGNGQQVDERFSVNVGAARFAERYRLTGAVSQEALGRALHAIAADLASLDGRSTPDTLVGMGGAITNLTAVKHHLATYDPDIVQGAELDRAEIDRQIELYRTLSTEDRREIVGLQPQRAEVILAGACIVKTVMEKLGKNSLTVSDRGLRHGLIVERFGT